MRKLFESAEDSFLDIEDKIKEELNAKAVEKIDNLEEEAKEEMYNENSEEDKETLEESEDEKKDELNEANKIDPKELKKQVDDFINSHSPNEIAKLLGYKIVGTK